MRGSEGEIWTKERARVVLFNLNCTNLLRCIWPGRSLRTTARKYHVEMVHHNIL